MKLEKLVKIIKNDSRRLIPLDELKQKMRKNEFEKLLTELKDSKYCRPLSNDLIFNFITIPSWGTKSKHYKIHGMSYSHIENINSSQF